jgi:hypothetical protein
MSDDDTRHSGSRWEPTPDDAAHHDTTGDTPDVPATGDPATDAADDPATRQIPATAWEPTPDSSLLAMPPIPAVASTQPRRPRRRAGLVAAAAAGLLAVGGAGGYALGTSVPAPHPPPSGPPASQVRATTTALSERTGAAPAARTTVRWAASDRRAPHVGRSTGAPRE